MKYYITILLALAITTFSFAQTSVSSFEDMTFGASAKSTQTKEQPTKTQATYQIGRLEETTDYSLFIPKSFSPNDDGIDDTFQVEARNILDFEILVFDQWGGFVYQSKEVTMNWNGAVNGKNLRKGPYIYVIKIKTINGLSKKYSGCLMIEE